MGEDQSRGGRRARLVNFSAQAGYIFGVDIGATSVDLALADFTGGILSRTDAAANVLDGPPILLDQVKSMMLSMLEEQSIPIEKIRGIGIGVPGPVEFSTGLLISPPIMPGWEAFPIRETFNEVFAQAVVMVDNDVNVMALGELRRGKIKAENCIFIKIGTGIGAGIVCKGKIYRGNIGCAGDVGHICVDYNGPLCHCGNVGCVEAMAAGPAIAAKAMQAAKEGRSAMLLEMMNQRGRDLTARDVAEAAAKGDRPSTAIIQETGKLIGAMLSSVVNFYNPSLILIGGGVSNSGYYLLSSIRRSVLQRSLPLSTQDLRIEYNSLRGDAGIYGAIYLGLDHIFST
ncbi:MAG: ROK family protein [Anaerolineaceae bacterium]|nr:ROK family protein [Anaerolineaceae bacterium]